MYQALTFAQAIPFILADLRAGQTPALLGLAGIGKSSLMNYLARVLKTKVFVLPVNQLADRADLTGVRLIQNAQGSWQQEAYPHAVINEAVAYALAHPDETPILFLDEFNRTSPDVTSAILSFQTLRSIGSIEFPPNLRITVAGNDTGNVTAIDEASISRFAVYRIKPDLDTFFDNVKNLNPYVRAVLTKYPDDLMAEALRETTAETSEDEEDDENTFAHIEFGDENAFTQVTRPRTIDFMSAWLNEMDLTKSQSQQERQTLGELFTNMLSEETNILNAGIHAHVGNTTFAQHLFEEIKNEFQTLATSTFVSNQPVLAHIRPAQDFINAMSRATDAKMVETLISQMTDEQKTKALVWLLEDASVSEINNMESITTFMTVVPMQIADITNSQDIITVMHANKISKVTGNLFIKSPAPSVIKWVPIIQSILN